MNVAKVVMDGNSQAVRIPKDFRLHTKEVWIEKLADGSLVLREKEPVPAGYSNILEYYAKNPFGKPITGFTELCNTDPSLDLPKQIF